MKKRKLLSLVMALVLVLAMTGCGKDDASKTAKQSPYEFYQEVSKNMEQVKDSEMKGTVSIKMPGKADGGLPLVSLNYNAKLIQHSKTDVDMAMNFTKDDLKYSTYYTDGYLYTNGDGTKIKMKMDMEDAMKMSGGAKMQTLTEEMLKDAVLTQEGKDTILEYTVSADQADEMLAAELGNYPNAAASLNSLSDMISFRDMKVQLVADENKMMKSSKVSVTLNLADQTDDAKKMEMQCVVDVEYVSINKGITIDFPDFSDYQEATV